LPQIHSIQDALSLEKGHLMSICLKVNFTDKDVTKATKLILENKVQMSFETQAELLAYAGNKLGWGLGAGYYTA